MNYLTEYLHPYLLQPVEFTLNDKVIRKGKIRVFNFKQYFIKFTLETELGDLKTFDVLYPFKIYKEGNRCVFNYHLSSFAANDMELFYRMKTVTKDNCLPAYDNVIVLNPIPSLL